MKLNFIALLERGMSEEEIHTMLWEDKILDFIKAECKKENINLGKETDIILKAFKNLIIELEGKDADNGRLGFPPWTFSYGPMESIEKFYENKKYFDFLGVKYIITEGYNFDSISVGIPGNTREMTKIQETEASISQSFVSPVNTINGIGVSISAFQLEENDAIILSLDSIPYDERLHRESTVKNITNQKRTSMAFRLEIEIL